MSNVIDTQIKKHLKIAKKLKSAKDAYFNKKNYKKVDEMTEQKRAIYKIINSICPHDQGRTEPTYWNDGVTMCYRCGNSKDCLTNGFVDGWVWG